MRVPNNPPVQIKWNPTWLYYLDKIIFILQVCTNIASILLFLLWQLLIIAIPPLWVAGLFPWFIYFLISWRSLSRKIRKKWSNLEKILVFFGVIANTAIVFLSMANSEYKSEKILEMIQYIIFFYAPTLTILLIFIRTNLYYHFSKEPTPPEIVMKRDYNEPPQWDEL